jgi:alkenylglycerophosphocholine/alkenylglycerophosphoethanolamine hydrolase
MLTAGGCLVGRALELPLLALVAKPVPVLCLALWTAPHEGRYPRLATLGLLLSMAGDVAIEWSFALGLALFLLAHLVYIAAFLDGSPPLGAWRALPVGAAIGLVYRVVSPGLGSLRPAVLGYMAAIGTMLWRAAARVDAWPSPASSALLGAVAFAASDSLLAVDRFHAAVPGAGYTILALYWLGQLGIAISASRGDAAHSG